MKNFLIPCFAACLVLWGVVCSMIWAADAPQFGVDFGRNRISHETGLPETFDPGKKSPQTNEINDVSPNVRWVKQIGSRTYSTPIVAEGCVLIGTNNDAKYGPEIEGDQGVLLCFDEKNGELLWQFTSPKIADIPFFDTAGIGITSPPIVHQGKVYFVSNRGELCCLNLHRNNNQAKNLEPEILWRFDMPQNLSVRQHDTNNCAVLYYDGLLYVNTANGLDDHHKNLANPEAPALVVFDAETGTPLARDNGWVGEEISHGSWCSPTLGIVEGQSFIFFGGCNGVLYAFPTLKKDDFSQKTAETEKELYRIKSQWHFRGEPWFQTETTKDDQPFEIGHGSKSLICLAPPVFAEGKLYMSFSVDGWTGGTPKRGWTVCLKPTATLSGDVTRTAFLWGTEIFEESILTTPAVHNGLAYLTHRKGQLFCYDAETGEKLETVTLGGDIWSSPLVADGKIYIGNDRRTFYILEEGKNLNILEKITMPDQMFGSSTAANQTLYIPVNGYLYAVH